MEHINLEDFTSLVILKINRPESITAIALLRWNPVTSLNLHGVQFRILKRGLEMLEVGGRLVYSTCSLNPLEDEAVIYRMLVEAGDAIQLADAAEKVQGLKFSTGISKWKIAMKDGAMYTEFDQVWSLKEQRGRTLG